MKVPKGRGGILTELIENQISAKALSKTVLEAVT
jgi:hypothetical protein